MPIKKAMAAIAIKRDVTASITPEIAVAPALEAALTFAAQDDWALAMELDSNVKPRTVDKIIKVELFFRLIKNELFMFVKNKYGSEW